MLAWGHFAETTLPPAGNSSVSYGQPFVLVMTPIATIFGFVFGVSVGATLFCSRPWGSLAALGCALVTISAISCLWLAHIAQYGLERTGVILYGPLVVGAVCLALFGGVVLMSRPRKAAVDDTSA
jgi:hypothetical protein